jgi:sugar/nucleoside kinase (ribokinase family)
MLSDRATPVGRPEPHLQGAAAIVCSGYALLDPSGDALARSLSARPSECRLTVACCALGTTEAAATIAERLAAARPDLLVCNLDEASAILRQSVPLDVASRELGSQLGMLAVVTDAQHGSAASRPDMPIVPGAAGTRPPVDTTGAGDAYVAALLDAILAATWPPTDAELHGAMSAGAALAASVVATVGAQAAETASTAGDRR